MREKITCRKQQRQLSPLSSSLNRAGKIAMRKEREELSGKTWKEEMIASFYPAPYDVETT
jgi:hypothetical protein